MLEVGREIEKAFNEVKDDMIKEYVDFAMDIYPYLVSKAAMNRLANGGREGIEKYNSIIRMSNTLKREIRSGSGQEIAYERLANEVYTKNFEKFKNNILKKIDEPVERIDLNVGEGGNIDGYLYTENSVITVTTIKVMGDIQRPHLRVLVKKKKRKGNKKR